jgi:spore coat protein U-like protein
MMEIRATFAVTLLMASLLMLSSASATSSCTVGATGVNFGSFSPLTGNNVDITGTVNVNCTDVTSYTVTLSTGSGSYSQRRMASGSYYLYYNLYLDAAYQQVWGDGSSGSYTVTLSNPVNGQNNVHTVYGCIPLSGQRAAHTGSYSDSVTVTVTY